MDLNRLLLLSNSPIKVARGVENEFITIKGPTIKEFNESKSIFIAVEFLTSTVEQLKKLIGISEDKNLKKDEILDAILQDSDFSEMIMEGFSKIIPGIQIKNNFLVYNNLEVSSIDLENISKILNTVMGNLNEEEEKEEDLSKLSELERKMILNERKIKEKKEKLNKKENTKEDSNINPLEDILMAISYEFGFTIDQMMDMNYFTLLWYYSYISKIHLYTFNLAAISSGAAKNIETDYFTNLKLK